MVSGQHFPDCHELRTRLLHDVDEQVKVVASLDLLRLWNGPVLSVLGVPRMCRNDRTVFDDFRLFGCVSCTFHESPEGVLLRHLEYDESIDVFSGTFAVGVGLVQKALTHQNPTRFVVTAPIGRTPTYWFNPKKLGVDPSCPDNDLSLFLPAKLGQVLVLIPMAADLVSLCDGTQV